MARKSRSAAKLSIDIAANVAQLQQDMGKAVNILGGFQKQVKGISTTLKGLFVLDLGRTLIPEIKQFASAINHLADVGDKAGSIKESFEALGGSASTIEEARKVMLGTVSAFDLMANANKGLMRGLPEFNSRFAELADLAERFAATQGKEGGEVLNQLTDALVSGRTKGLEPFGFALEGLKGKAEIQQAVFEQLRAVIDRLPPSLDSVANAQGAFNVSLEDGVKEIGIAVNDSNDLTLAFREMDAALHDVNWTQFGESLATIMTQLVELGATVLPVVVREINYFARGLDYLFGNSSQANLDRKVAEIERLKASLSDPLTLGSRGGIREKIAALEGELKQGIEASEKAAEEVEQKKTEALKKAAEERARIEREFQERREREAGERAGKEMSSLKEAFQKEVSKLQSDTLQESMRDAIQAVDSSAFQQAAQKLKEAYKQSIIDAHKEAVAKGAVTLEAVQKYAEESAQYQADKYSEEFDRALKDKAEKEKQLSEQTYRDSVNVWRNLFSNALRGIDGDFRSMLQELAVGFGAELAASLGGTLTGTGNGSLADIGALIANQITTSIKGGGGLGDMLGSIFGLSTESAHAAGISGPGLENGQFMQSAQIAQYLPAIISTVTAALDAKKTDKASKSNAGTGGAIGSGLGAGIGAAFGGPAGAQIGAQIGQMLGSTIGGMFKWGPQNPETKARHAFANYIEESFQKLGQVSFFDANKKIKNTKGSAFNFLEGDTGRFNNPDWMSTMDSWGDKAKTTFLGLGAALKEVQGITEDVGAQIGFLLGENLAGDIDNARLLVQQLGLDFEEMEEALVKAGRSGSMSWHEVEVGIQGITEAFKPGLEAVGDVKGALDELLGSGGRGVAALKGVKDMAVETLQAGGKTLEDMRRLLLEQGADESTVNAIMQAIEQRGIKTLEALASANDRVAGGVVADVYSANKGIADMWDKMSADLKSLKDNLEELPKELDIKINLKTDMDSNTKSAIDAGMLPDVTSGMSIPSPNLPQTSRVSVGGAGAIGRSARSNLGAVQVNIDARGAQRGVEADIKNAMASVERRAVRRSVATLAAMEDRG